MINLCATCFECFFRMSQSAEKSKGALDRYDGLDETMEQGVIDSLYFTLDENLLECMNGNGGSALSPGESRITEIKDCRLTPLSSCCYLNEDRAQRSFDAAKARAVT